mgnify:CR=1 FL=1
MRNTFPPKLTELSKNYAIMAMASSALLLTACGGGTETPPVVVTPPVAITATLTATVSGLPTGSNLSLQLDKQTVSTSSNGVVNLTSSWSPTQAYHVKVASQPSGAYCTVQRGIGKPLTASTSSTISDIEVKCESGSAAATAELFDADQFPTMRLTVSVDEWEAFAFSLRRTGNQTDLYRIGKLDYLDNNGVVKQSIDNVGFRMRGNTSRTDPEVRSGNLPYNPTRFHWNLKFDETFEDDESVYSCIDSSGNPTKINSSSCFNRVARDIPAIAANDNRTFLGLESMALKMNKDDPGYLHEMLAYTVLQDHGVATGRANHAALELVITPSETTTTLYGRALPQTHQMGVFTMVEPVDKVLVKNRYGKNGYLFKVGVSNLAQPTPTDCLDYNPALHGHQNGRYCNVGVEVIDPVSRADWLGADKVLDVNYVNNHTAGSSSQFAAYKPAFDLKTKKDEIVVARTELNKLMQLIKSNPSQLQLAQALDVDSFIKAQAADIVLGAVDHYVRIANNYYVYLNPTTKKWVYLTYDYDFSWRNNHPQGWTTSPIPVFDDVAYSTIFSGSGNNWNSRHFGNEPVLYNLVFADANNRQQLLTQVAQLRKRWLDWEHRVEPISQVWLNKITDSVNRTSASSEFPDSSFRPQAVLGGSYDYLLWGQSSTSTDTLRNYVIQRNNTLAAEAP